MSRSITTDEDQSASFVELFFDLAFVFAVTQIVQVIHHHLAWADVGRGLVLFWLVWWAWTQFAWALNSADTTHPDVESDEHCYYRGRLRGMDLACCSNWSRPPARYGANGDRRSEDRFVDGPLGQIG